MRLIRSIVIAIVCLVFIGAFIAKSDDAPSEHSQHAGSKEFEHMKSLVGTWEGTSSKDGEKVTVTYKTTAGGSAILETLFSGTPHEMVSVYYDNGGKLGMTHYCMLGNQPQMTLKSADDNKIDLVFISGDNIDPKKAPHMHEVSMSFVDKDYMVQEWTMYENGKAKDTVTFKLARMQ
ncbi:MAG TPA: hypothetical protein VH878_00025 [Thermodesulfobacteriota bacterium]|jgi:hypothetical protein